MARKKPSRSRQRKKCDALWSKCVRLAARDRCAVCGASPTQAHHPIRRDAMYYRHWPENGIALCFQHHTGSNTDSAHGAPLGFIDLLMRFLPNQYVWWEDNRHEIHIGEKVDYEAVYADLKMWHEELKAGRYVRRFLGMKEHSDAR